MSRPACAILLVLVLVAATLSTPADAQARLEPVCGGKFTPVACLAERVVGARYSLPMGWGADDLRKAHALPPDAPGGGTIAIIDVGAYPNLEADLAAYRTQYALPPCTAAAGCLRQMDYRGGPPLAAAADPDAAELDEQIALETALDVDMASAACPSCKLLEVQIPREAVPKSPDTPDAPDTADAPPVNYDGYATAFGIAVRTAVAQGAQAVSISYGLPGDDSMLRGSIADPLTAPGVAVVAASGDSGFEANEFLWPQALPTVTSAGGTTLVQQGGNYSEGAWAAAGSSCAPGASAPVGQPDDIGKLCVGARAGVDVSAVAENLAVYTTYSPQKNQPLGWTVAAGTSAAAPFIAGVYVASGGLGGVLGPNLLYRAQADQFSDITSGTSGGVSNGRCVAPGDRTQTFDGRLCGAGPGWDGPTGLGTPRGLFRF